MLDMFNETGLYAPVKICEHVVKAVHSLRTRLPGCSGKRVIIVPESNTAYESQNYALALIEAQVPNVVLMDEDTKHVGVRSSNKSKKRMVVLFANALRTHTVKFHPMLITHSSKRVGDAVVPYTSDEIRGVLVQQASDFKRIRKTKAQRKADDDTEYTESYNGKMGGRLDDLMMAALIAYIGWVIYRQKYEEMYKTKPPLYVPS